MSLRREIHLAFDGITPPTFGMPERVVQTVLVGGTTQRRKKGMHSHFRAPLSFVAVFVLIAMVALALIGNRLIQDWNALHNSSPAGDVYQSQVAQLEARPLHIPSPANLADCKSGPFNAEGDLGSLQVSRANVGTWDSDWGVYYDYMVYTDSKISGPILVRARDLFAAESVVFVGQYANGPVVGSEIIDGSRWDRHPYLLLNANTTRPGPGTRRMQWNFIAGVPKSSSRSTGWQIDGIGFSETFLAC